MVNDLIESDDHLELIDSKLDLPSLKMPTKSQYNSVQKINNFNYTNQTTSE